MNRAAWSVCSVMFIAVALQMVALTAAAPAGDFISSLPGQPPVSFKQYSGYITVDESQSRRLFYYFTEAVNSSATTPLVLWLNGGPDCSSLTGAFSELGPFRPNSSGTGLTLNDASWNQVANVIFLESPAGVGFSYSDNSSDYYSDDEKTAKDSLVFLLEWLAEYPEYNSTDFYVTGESYAGHYVPQLATSILENNKVSGQPQINLKGIMVGNPLFDYTIDLISSGYEYAWGHGMVSEDTHDAIVKECNYSAPTLSGPCLDALSTADDEAGAYLPYLNAYDVLVDTCLADIDGQAQRLYSFSATNLSAQETSFPPVDPCITDQLTTYMNLVDVQAAMHAKKTAWVQCNRLGNNSLSYNGNDSTIPMAPVLANLVNSSLRVWVFSGDADIVVPFVGTRHIVNSLAKSLKLDITSTYQQWYQGCQIGGWSISWGPLVFSTVRGAGHMVPMYQPARSLQLFTSFLAGHSGPPRDPGSC